MAGVDGRESTGPALRRETRRHGGTRPAARVHVGARWSARVDAWRAVALAVDREEGGTRGRPAAHVPASGSSQKGGLPALAEQEDGGGMVVCQIPDWQRRAMVVGSRQM
jgi:hypothetical protein